MGKTSTLRWLAMLALPCCGGGASVQLLDSSTPQVDSATPKTDGATATARDASAKSAKVDSRPVPANEIRSNKLRDLAPVVAASDAAQLAADNVAFGVDLYGQLRARNTGNFIFSQTSISLDLAMLYGGAANDTAAQMATALHFTLPPERLHPAFNALDLALSAPPAGDDANAFQLVLANSSWLQAGYSVLPSYLDLLAENYDAGLFLEDFATAPEIARTDINRWVSDETEQMIPALFDPGTISPDARLVLANAVYFHGIWAQAFKPTTSIGTFHAPNGDVSVPMMSSQETSARLWSAAGWTAVSLGYQGGTASMILLVPDLGTFDAFEQGLTATSLATMLDPAGAMTGAVTMPRFKFSTPSPLNAVLASLGMTDAFDPSLADFSGIDGTRNLSIDKVIHKAVIAVDEQGTTAAAATGTTGTVLVLLPEPFRVDRPFLFFIRHNSTGAILFQGRVVDPSQ